MSSTGVICIVNLDFSATYSQVKTEFGKVGSIKRLFLSRPTSPKFENGGYAFCEYYDSDSVDDAVTYYRNRVFLDRDVCLYYGHNHPPKAVPPHGWDLHPRRELKRPRTEFDDDIVQATDDFLNSLDFSPPPPSKIPRIVEMPEQTPIPPIPKSNHVVVDLLNTLTQFTVDDILVLSPKVRSIFFDLCAEWRASAH